MFSILHSCLKVSQSAGVEIHRRPARDAFPTTRCIPVPRLTDVTAIEDGAASGLEAGFALTDSLFVDPQVPCQPGRAYGRTVELFSAKDVPAQDAG